MVSLSLLQGIFLTQELNRGLLYCRQIFYQLSYKGRPKGNILFPPLFFSSFYHSPEIIIIIIIIIFGQQPQEISEPAERHSK